LELQLRLYISLFEEFPTSYTEQHPY
jgi:hypothetical protein